MTRSDCRLSVTFSVQIVCSVFHKLSMPALPLPPISTLREYFHYNPDNGELSWKKAAGRKIKPGRVVSNKTSNGYIQVQLKGRMYTGHRIAWALFYGKDPGDYQVDHINGVRHDNRIVNLRLVTRSQNAANRKLHKNNTSGIKGVSWCKYRKKWVAQIVTGGKTYKRRFDSKAGAIAERYIAEIKHQGVYSSMMSRDIKSDAKIPVA